MVYKPTNITGGPGGHHLVLARINCKLELFWCLPGLFSPTSDPPEAFLFGTTQADSNSSAAPVRQLEWIPAWSISMS